jgi:hypothetical protein
MNFSTPKAQDCADRPQSDGGHAAAQGRVIKTVAPGQMGARRWEAQFGSALICVRYRACEAQGRRYTTVEIVVDERATLPAQPKAVHVSPTKDTILGVRIHGYEWELRRVVKAAGARWDPVARLWFLGKSQVRAHGLEDRVVESCEVGHVADM